MEYNWNAGIDLHIHSSASDGTLSPAEILFQAKNLHLKAIAITDHDTIEGSKAALSVGIPPSTKFLTGVEISVSPPPLLPLFGSFHILGYAIRLDDSDLNKTLKVLQTARKNRNPRIMERLCNQGFDLSLEELYSEFGDSQVGRPHIARLMVKKGYVKSIDEAFDEYIGSVRPAYVDKYRLYCARAIEIIDGAGGIAVLDHPFILKTKRKEVLEDLIITLKKMGLRGLEVYYPDHSSADTDYYSMLARRHGLLMTGGTDFHGFIKSDIEMGYGNGSFQVPYELSETLMESC